MFVDSFEDTASETYHFYHSLNPPNSSSSEALPEYSEVGLGDSQAYTTPDGCNPVPPRVPDIVVEQAAEGEGRVVSRNVCCMFIL